VNSCVLSGRTLPVVRAALSRVGPPSSPLRALPTTCPACPASARSRPVPAADHPARRRNSASIRVRLSSAVESPPTGRVAAVVVNLITNRKEMGRSVLATVSGMRGQLGVPGTTQSRSRAEATTMGDHDPHPDPNSDPTDDRPAGERRRLRPFPTYADPGGAIGSSGTIRAPSREGVPRDDGRPPRLAAPPVVAA